MTNNEKSDIHSGIAWAMVFSLAAIIMGVIALATRYPRTDLSLDYMGVIVGILTLLVTALIGWQVFNAIENVKTLRKMEDLEAKLKEQIKLSEMNTQAMFDFAEAHRLEQEARRSTDRAYQYGCHARALLLYLKSDIDISYPPLQGKIPVLAMIINQIERSQNEDDKILFARQMTDFDSINEEILDEIGKRDKTLRKLRRDIINLKTKRHDLFLEHFGKETSADIMLREYQENQERKKQNSETEPPTPAN